MKVKERNLLWAVCLTIACIMQLIGTLRYVKRLPDDTVGVTLFITTCILYAILATVHYGRWRKSGRNAANES